MRLIPHQHEFECNVATLEWRDGRSEKPMVFKAILCKHCKQSARDWNEAKILTMDSTVLRATALCAWAIALGTLVVTVALLYRWSFAHASTIDLALTEKVSHEISSARRRSFRRLKRPSVSRYSRMCTEANPCTDTGARAVRVVRYCSDQPCPPFDEMWSWLPLDWQEAVFSVPQQEALK